MRLTGDIASPRVMVLKAALFVIAGLMCGGLLAIRQQSLKDAMTAVLIFGLGAWCLCRSYYFMFYVIQRYCDPEYRYSGVLSAICWAVRQRGPRKPAKGGITDVNNRC